MLRYVNGAVGNGGIAHVDGYIAEISSAFPGQAYQARPRCRMLNEIRLLFPLKPAHWYGVKSAKSL